MKKKQYLLNKLLNFKSLKLLAFDKTMFLLSRQLFETSLQGSGLGSGQQENDNEPRVSYISNQ